MREDQVAEFREHIESISKDWDRVDVRLVALQRDRQNTLELVAMRATILDPDEEEDVLTPPDIDQFQFRRSIIPWREFDSILDALSQGEPFSLGGTFYHILDTKGPGIRWYSQVTSHQSNVGTTFTLEGTAEHETRFNDWEDQIERGLRSAEAPWDGLDDVTQHFLKTREHHRDWSRKTRIEIELDLGVWFHRSEIANGALELQFIVGPGTVIDDLQVGFIAWHEEERWLRWCVPASKMMPEKDDFIVQLRYSLPEGLRRLSILPTYRSYQAGSGQLTLPPGDGLHAVRYLEHLTKDPKILENSLDQIVTTRADRLEEWAVRGFHCLNFQTLHTGPLEAADVVAHSPWDDWSILVECTVGTPNNKEKLTKLHTRRSEMQKILEREVVPVLVTNLPREDVSGASQTAAAEDGIALLAREDLVELARLVYESPSPLDVRSFLERRVPERAGHGMPRAGMRGRRFGKPGF